MEGYWVYGLLDPRTGELRYVGKTVKGEYRLSCHVSEAKVGGRATKKKQWIRSLLKVGLRPEIVVLETSDAEQVLLDLEKFWIASMWAAGAELLNHNEGCTGLSGRHHSAETRAKISAAGRTWTRGDAQRAKMSAKMLGRPKSEAHRRAISEARKGLKYSEAGRTSLSRARGGSPILVTQLTGGRSKMCGSQRLAAQFAGVSQRAVQFVLIGKWKAAKGYSFHRIVS